MFSMERLDPLVWPRDVVAPRMSLLNARSLGRSLETVGSPPMKFTREGETERSASSISSGLRNLSGLGYARPGVPLGPLRSL